MSSTVVTPDGLNVLDEFCAWTDTHAGAPYPEALLQRLDAHGFLAGVDETFADYTARLKTLATALHECYDTLAAKGEFIPDPEFVFDAADLIPPTVYRDADETTRNAYGFQVDWVPGFYPKKNLGLLWAGCTLISETLPYPVFTLRKEFRNREIFMKIYSKKELLAHEICHAARAPLNDPVYEEHFAYGISNRAFRRYFGNCFRTEWDALMFLSPVLVALAQIVIFALGYGLDPLVWRLLFIVSCMPIFYLFIRNLRDRGIVKRARVILVKHGVANPDAVLFRCPTHEIRALAKGTLKPENAWQGDTPREQIIRDFLNRKPEKITEKG